ncbi:G protein-coupled receptor-4A [Proboscivirus elephantidbeta4]|uniref:G protein-coupled receptor-4A n=1 Tax=Elephant endotheliotropic herpesvirus 4 TaxID=548914 RepID=A0A0S1TKK8_9BETA|nr:G protein-coupled receptor-4A [Elephant endotheliotropic herpesvirus 4]ALM25955.1 G protein-coupled receptor-4A [Elephant endotheliotropic herpesvirus 4]
MGGTLKQIFVGSISLQQQQQKRRSGVLSPGIVVIDSNTNDYYSHHHHHHYHHHHPSNDVMMMSHHYNNSNNNNTITPNIMGGGGEGGVGEGEGEGGMWRLSADTNDQVPDVSHRILCWMLASLFIPVVLGLMIRVIWLLVKKKHNPILQIQLPFLAGLLGLFACALSETQDFVSSLYLFTICYSVCATCVLTHILFVCNQQQDPSSCFALVVGLTGHVLVVLEYGALDERFASYYATSLAQRNADFLLFCAHGILLGALTAALCLWCPARKAVLRSQKTYMMYTTVANLIVWYRFIYRVVCHRGGGDTTWLTISIEGSTMHACIYLVGYALPMYAIFDSGAAVV